VTGIWTRSFARIWKLEAIMWGIVLGVSAGAMISTFLSKLLFGVPAFDPISFAEGAVMLLAVALVASYLPARRAARVDPIVALRCE